MLIIQFLQYSMQVTQIDTLIKEEVNKAIQLISQDVIEDQIELQLYYEKPQNSQSPSHKKRFSKKKSEETEKQGKIKSASSITATPSRNSEKNICENQQKYDFVEQKVKKSNQQIKSQTKISNFLQFLDKRYQFNGDFVKVKYFFTKTARNFEMQISRDLPQFLTVRKQPKQRIKNFFAMCLPIGTQKNVFQLQKHGKNKNGIQKIKIVQISGNEMQFQEFLKDLIYQLWMQKLFILPSQQIAELIFFASKGRIKVQSTNCEQAFSQIALKRLDTADQIQKWRQSFMEDTKRAQKIIYQAYQSHIQKMGEIIQIDQKIQEVVFKNFQTYKFYRYLNGLQNQEFLCKKEAIMKKMTFGQIFKFLQIEEISCQLSAQNSFQYYDSQTIQYRKVIDLLSELKTSLAPYENIKIIQQFGLQMCQTYYAYKKIQQIQDQMQQVFDMDTQLPITIYCILMCKNEDIKLLITALLDYYQTQDDFQNENRLLTAINAAIQFIRVQWDTQTEKRIVSRKSIASVKAALEPEVQDVQNDTIQAS